MNYTDTNKIRKFLVDIGLEETEDIDSADLLILNTCAVRQKAEDKVAGVGRKVINLKKDNPNFTVVMTGCMSQRINRRFDTVRSDYAESMRRRFDWVDYFVNIGDLKSIAGIVGREVKNVDYSEFGQSYEDKVVGCLPISIGCDNFCSFCIVPYTRGREISLSFDRIKKRYNEMVDKRFGLIYLLGQNVNSWESDGMKFPDLLNELASVSTDTWLTFLSSHPKDFSDDLIDVMAQNQSVCRYLNLAVQSGSDSILRSMNRKYTKNDYLKKVYRLREKMPDVRLSTDIIVGFPGETDRDFEETVDLVKKAEFAMAYVSEYSPREGTAAEKLKDDIPRNIKKERKGILKKMIMENARRFNLKKVGKEVEVLVTKPNFGVEVDLTDVQINGDAKVGDRVVVKVETASESGVTGKLI
jgi:tRNA-2-methylthio-N6-dimethylallyladenosine synthase